MVEEPVAVVVVRRVTWPVRDAVETAGRPLVVCGLTAVGPGPVTALRTAGVRRQDKTVEEAGERQTPARQGGEARVSRGGALRTTSNIVQGRANTFFCLALTLLCFFITKFVNCKGQQRPYKDMLKN